MRSEIASVTAKIYALLLLGCMGSPANAQSWNEAVRGSWVRQGPLQEGDVVLADRIEGCEIVCSTLEHSAVKQAARLLAKDILKISGYEPPIYTQPSGKRIAIFLITTGNYSLPSQINSEKLGGKWEAYHILTHGNNVWLAGSNFRGTAFAVYTLAERLGIDPLYIWTAYKPEKHPRLVLKKTDCFVNSPVFRYRGFFHDDQDILPRPLDENGIPQWSGGTIPMVWYERYFETALRLRMNMVAPYVREIRPYEVQKTASDWGLFYTSHHYDVLLSNPWGYERFGLAEKRNAGNRWDWFTNKQGMINFWKGGVLENRELDCIWPVALRGTSDSAYPLPPNATPVEKNKLFEAVLKTQVDLVKESLSPEKSAIFHFTMYHEMLDCVRGNKLQIPGEVILVWPDDGDGRMLDLPEPSNIRKNGVYYHLAFKGWSTKQITHIVSPYVIEEQFRRIVESGATEFMLLNVSELRDYIMEARMIAEICWNPQHAISDYDAADRYISWWCREYFGDAAGDAGRAYHQYYRIIDDFDSLRFGKTILYKLLRMLDRKFNREDVGNLYPEDNFLRKRELMYEYAFEIIASALNKMSEKQKQFFFENVILGLLMDRRPTQAALELNEALNEVDLQKAWQMCEQAIIPLEMLEDEILRAERSPFERWYGVTEARQIFRYNEDFPLRRAGSPHGSYANLKGFLRQKKVMKTDGDIHEKK